MKKYFDDLIRDKRNSLLDKLIKILLLIISWFYGLGIYVWDFLYTKKILKSCTVPIKIISVGNLTVGGTGKTPFVMYLAEKLRENGFKPAIILRGYGDDEWRLYQDKFIDVRVYIEKNRAKAALKAKEDGCDVAILDDGFQHRRIKKDFEILLMDSMNPFGNKKIFPRGILREYTNAISRSDMVILTKSDFGDEHLVWLKVILKKYEINSVFDAGYKAISLINVYSKDIMPIEGIKNKKVLIFSALADAAYFKYVVNNIGANIIKELDYIDHYAYNSKDIEQINSMAMRLGCDYIITTEKDAVKLMKLDNENYKIYALHIEFEIKQNETELTERIIRCCRG